MKISLRFFLTVSLLMSIAFCHSQNCREIGDWMNTIKKEYPDLKMNTAMPSGVVENMAINLYSDKFYVPSWGSSFAFLSKNGRAKSWRKIQTCYAKENYNADRYKNWVFKSIIYNYHIDFRTDTFTSNIKKRNQLRQELENTYTALKSNDLDYNDIQILKKDLSTKFSVLFPSELILVTNEITKQEGIQTENKLMTDFETVKKLPLEYASIDKVLNFKSKNATLFSKLNTAQQQKITSQINTKITEILTVLMFTQLTELDKIESTELTVAEINTQLLNFKKAYRRVMDLKKVQTTLKVLQAKKTEIVSNLMPVLETAMNDTANEKEISELYQLYLVDLEPNSPIANQLQIKFEQRRQFLVKEKERIVKESILLQEQERLTFLATNGKEEGSMSLNTKNLFYAEFFDYLYRGHLENINVERESEEFLTIFNAYISAFGKKCPSALPENKVQLMTLICDEYTVTKESLSGFELYRSCNRWVKSGTGIFVKPELYKAKLKLETAFEKSTLAYLKDLYTNPDATGNSVDQIHRLRRLSNDMKLFFNINECTGKAIAQFEKNLHNFAMNQPLQRLKGMSVYEKMRMSGAPEGKQHIERLIGDIVRQQSSTWAVNKYISDSITNLRTFTGQDGETIVAYKANYRFSNTFLGNDIGAVTIRLKNGLPDCIIFADFPNNCKKPSASLVMAYSNGEYSL
ncbi:MAG: hypothetical protein WBB27_14270 [Maribacter sp.]